MTHASSVFSRMAQGSRPGSHMHSPAIQIEPSAAHLSPVEKFAVKGANHVSLVGLESPASKRYRAHGRRPLSRRLGRPFEGSRGRTPRSTGLRIRRRRPAMARLRRLHAAFGRLFTVFGSYSMRRSVLSPRWTTNFRVWTSMPPRSTVSSCSQARSVIGSPRPSIRYVSPSIVTIRAGPSMTILMRPLLVAT